MLCILSALLVMGCEPATDLQWGVSFECEEAAAGVVSVRTRVLRGGCDGEEIYQTTSFRSAGAENVPPPAALDFSLHGFEATSLDRDDQVLAITCQEMIPEAGEHVEIIL